MRHACMTLGLTLALFSAACGAAGPMTEVKPPAAPAGAPVTVAVAEAPSPIVAASQPNAKGGDSDHDGIPDKEDACPNGGGGADGCPDTTPASGTGAKAPGAEAAHRDVQKLIYTAHLTLAVFQVDAALGKVESIAKDEGGYLSSRADREIVIRVPRGHFDTSIKRIEATGDVLHREIKAEDVTDEFFDLETRLKNARAMRERLVALLAKAPVKEAIEIEKELGRITEEIERMEGKLKLFADKISFSTITVSLQPVDANPVAQAIPLPFPWLQELGLAHLLAVHN